MILTAILSESLLSNFKNTKINLVNDMNMVTKNLLPFAAVQARKMRHKKKAAAYKRPENQIFYYAKHANGTRYGYGWDQCFNKHF